MHCVTFNVDIFVNLYGRILKFIEFLKCADFIEGEEAEMITEESKHVL